MSGGVFKELFRRSSVTWQQNDVVTITTSKIYHWDFKTPGYFSFDFMCNVGLKTDGSLPNKYFRVKVNGITRYEVRADWAWQRTFIYVDSGPMTVTFETEGYGVDDNAKIRRIVHRMFKPVLDYEIIESAKMPKPLEQTTPFQVLQGWQRYQRTGPRGTELEFILVFTSIDKWRNFMRDINNVFVIRGDYGTYGGVILPQDVDTARQGNLILTKIKMNSPLTAGVGVDGI